MRTVAKQLGIGAMSLYRYVFDRDQLEELVVELVLGAVDISAPRGSAGRKLAVLADRVRVAVSEHPAVVPLLLIHRHRALSSLRWGEAVLTVLADAGFTGKRRVIAFRAVLGYVFGALQVERFGPLSGMGTRALADAAGRGVSRSVRNGCAGPNRGPGRRVPARVRDSPARSRPREVTVRLAICGSRVDLGHGLKHGSRRRAPRSLGTMHGCPDPGRWEPRGCRVRNASN